jgi:nitroreductase
MIMFISIVHLLPVMKSVETSRTSQYNIHPLLLNRTSPRSMAGSLSKKELLPLFEAARWAPSSYNAQLWRFVYALRGTKYWKTFIDLLVPENRSWAQDAGALVVVVTRKKFEYNNKTSRTAELDAGAACQNLALEGFYRGLAVHFMEGFNYKKAATACAVTSAYSVLAMIAIGKKKGAEKVSQRRPLSDIMMEGRLHKI